MGGSSGEEERNKETYCRRWSSNSRFEPRTSSAWELARDHAIAGARSWERIAERMLYMVANWRSMSSERDLSRPRGCELGGGLYIFSATASASCRRV